MEIHEFTKLREEFQNADLEKKIDIYTTIEGLTVEQYKALLKLFPMNEISKLEAALG